MMPGTFRTETDDERAQHTDEVGLLHLIDHAVTPDPPGDCKALSSDPFGPLSTIDEILRRYASVREEVEQDPRILAIKHIEQELLEALYSLQECVDNPQHSNRTLKVLQGFGDMDLPTGVTSITGIHVILHQLATSQTQPEVKNLAASLLGKWQGVQLLPEPFRSSAISSLNFPEGRRRDGDRNKGQSVPMGPSNGGHFTFRSPTTIAPDPDVAIEPITMKLYRTGITTASTVADSLRYVEQTLPTPAQPFGDTAHFGGVKLPAQSSTSTAPSSFFSASPRASSSGMVTPDSAANKLAAPPDPRSPQNQAMVPHKPGGVYQGADTKSSEPLSTDQSAAPLTTVIQNDRFGNEGSCARTLVMEEGIKRYGGLPFEKATRLENTAACLQKSLDASRLSEQRATSELSDLRKEKSKQKKELEDELRKAKDRRHKDFQAEVQAKVKAQVQEGKAKLETRLRDAEAKAGRYDRILRLHNDLEKELGLTRSERDATLLAKADLEDKHKILQKNAAATQEGYDQVRQEKEELEQQRSALQDELHDIASERDGLKDDLARLAVQKSSQDHDNLNAASRPSGIKIVVNNNKPTELGRLRRIKDGLQKERNSIWDQQLAYDEEIKDVESHIAIHETQRQALKNRSRGSVQYSRQSTSDRSTEATEPSPDFDINVQQPSTGNGINPPVAQDYYQAPANALAGSSRSKRYSRQPLSEFDRLNSHGTQAESSRQSSPTTPRSQNNSEAFPPLGSTQEDAQEGRNRFGPVDSLRITNISASFRGGGRVKGKRGSERWNA